MNMNVYIENTPINEKLYNTYISIEKFIHKIEQKISHIKQDLYDLSIKVPIDIYKYLIECYTLIKSSKKLKKEIIEEFFYQQLDKI